MHLLVPTRRAILAALLMLVVSSVVFAQQGTVNVSVTGNARPGGSITVTVSGTTAASISADLNGTPLSPECFGPRVLRNGKIEQTIEIPAGATGTLNVTVSTPNGIVTTAVPITGADG